MADMNEIFGSDSDNEENQHEEEQAEEEEEAEQEEDHIQERNFTKISKTELK